MQRTRSWLWGMGILALVLGCASPESAAQDRGGPSSQPSDRQAQPEDDPRVYKATIQDRVASEDQREYDLVEAVVFEPEVSLFGGGESGTKRKRLFLKRGAATIEVPFQRIARIDVGSRDEDRLPLTITLKAPKGGGPTPQPLKGTVKGNLELHGTYAKAGLKTVVKLHEAKSVKLSVEREK